MIQKTKAILEAKDYRSLIRGVLSSERAPVSLERFAERCGIKSKGVLSEMLSGRRTMTAGMLPKVTHGLRFHRKMEKRYFELLVFKEEPHLRPPDFDAEASHREILNLKSRLRSRFVQKEPQANLSSVAIFQVYAAIGEFEPGTSLHEIRQKTGLDERRTKEAVDHLQQMRLLKPLSQTHYCTHTDSLDVEGLGINEHFKMAMIEAFVSLSSRSKNMERFGNDLFFLTAFSIEERKEQEFKQRLRQCLYDLIDEFQATSGDKVKTIALGSF